MDKNPVSISMVLIMIMITGTTLVSYQKAFAQVIYNNSDQCATDLSANPPRSASGVPVPVPQQNIAAICANLTGIPGSLSDLTGSFDNCISYLTAHSTLAQDQKNMICNNLNPH